MFNDIFKNLQDTQLELCCFWWPPKVSWFKGRLHLWWGVYNLYHVVILGKKKWQKWQLNWTFPWGVFHTIHRKVDVTKKWSKGPLCHKTYVYDECMQTFDQNCLSTDKFWVVRLGLEACMSYWNMIIWVNDWKYPCAQMDQRM